ESVAPQRLRPRPAPSLPAARHPPHLRPRRPPPGRRPGHGAGLHHRPGRRLPGRDVRPLLVRLRRRDAGPRPGRPVGPRGGPLVRLTSGLPPAEPAAALAERPLEREIATDALRRGVLVAPVLIGAAAAAW